MIDHRPNSQAEHGQGLEPRQILLISRQDVVAERLLAVLNPPNLDYSCCEVQGDLMALGHIGAHGAPDVVITRSNGLNDSAAATARALRQLAPRARLLFLSHEQTSASACRAMDVGFDEHLPETVTTAQLHAAVLGKPSVGANGVKSQPHTYDNEAEAQDPGDEAMIDEAMGDVDLIERMLKDRASIRNMAVNVIRRESGVEDFDWQANRDRLPQNRVVAEVTYQNRRCGFLHGPATVPQHTVTAWAAWLGRWLAMEQHINHLWHMAMTDELTGIWNRRYFQRFLDSILEKAARERFNVTLMVFDIDDFKTYNDHYGHSAGDEILRETARMMESVVRQSDVVARIGGDEFAVIFWDAEAPRRPDSHHPHDVVVAARRFQQAICDYRFPKLAEGPATLSISGGLAGFPWDGRTPSDLLQKADEMSMRSKHQGKNALTFGPGAQRVCQFYSADLPGTTGEQTDRNS